MPDGAMFDPVVRTADRTAPAARGPEIPAYLREYYDWFYVQPASVRRFERPWLVNLILLGHYRKLTEAALAALGPDFSGHSIQLACVYGALTPKLAARVAESGGTLDVVDVLPAQLDNLRRKLGPASPVRLLRENTAALSAPTGSADRALLFFLFHEQPADVRLATMRETLRAVRPGGRIVIVDYAQPAAWHPARWLLLPVLRRLEPFAGDLWDRPPTDWLPKPGTVTGITRETYFGGLYQKIVIEV